MTRWPWFGSHCSPTFFTGRDKVNTVGLKVTVLIPCAFVKIDACTDVNKQHDDYRVSGPTKSNRLSIQTTDQGDTVLWLLDRYHHPLSCLLLESQVYFWHWFLFQPLLSTQSLGLVDFLISPQSSIPTAKPQFRSGSALDSITAAASYRISLLAV